MKKYAYKKNVKIFNPWKKKIFLKQKICSHNVHTVHEIAIEKHISVYGYAIPD